MVKIAVLVDGSFYLKRYQYLFGSCLDYRNDDAVQAATVFRYISNGHIHHKKDEFLYRILFYDCPPFGKRVHNPITQRPIDFEKSSVALFRKAFFGELKKQRKVALRLGHIKDHSGWVIKPNVTKELLAGRKTLKDLVEGDVYYDVTQKGVDMRIGLDIASLAYKRLVDRIVLISGDSDFVSAAKVARREGIDFVLDPMWNHIDDALFEHIDGLNSVCPDKTRMPATIEEYLKHTPILKQLGSKETNQSVAETPEDSNA